MGTFPAVMYATEGFRVSPLTPVWLGDKIKSRSDPMDSRPEPSQDHSFPSMTLHPLPKAFAHKALDEMGPAVDMTSWEKWLGSLRKPPKSSLNMVDSASEDLLRFGFWAPHHQSNPGMITWREKLECYPFISIVFLHVFLSYFPMKTWGIAQPRKAWSSYRKKWWVPLPASMSYILPFKIWMICHASPVRLRRETCSARTPRELNACKPLRCGKKPPRASRLDLFFWRVVTQQTSDDQTMAMGNRAPGAVVWPFRSLGKSVGHGGI